MKQFSTIQTLVYTLTIPLLLSLNISCNHFVEVPPPQTRIVAEAVFNSDATATASINGLYSTVMNLSSYPFNGGMTIYPAYSADELLRTSPTANENAFLNNGLLPDNTTLGTFWPALYNYIYHANAILEGLRNSTGVSQSLKSQLTGEAKFMRAFCYFYLVNLYGDVPLELSTDYRVNEIMPRTSATKVYDQITADLIDAQNLVSATYQGSGRTRPNKWAVTALLSRVYLFRGDYSNAETQASAVIANTTLYYLPVLASVFSTTSPEAIWQLSPVSTTVNTTEGNLFIPATATVIPGYTLTPGLYASFETTDKRKTTWIGTNTVSNQPYYYPSKYKIKTGGAPYTEYNMVLRLAEMFLVRAEARVRQNNLSDGKSDLDQVRIRAGLLGTTATTQVDLLTAIEQESRVEFFCEWGHRWFDLKRTSRADAVIGALKGSTFWQSTDVYYPLLLNDILANPFLIQNAGYN